MLYIKTKKSLIFILLFLISACSVQTGKVDLVQDAQVLPVADSRTLPAVIKQLLQQADKDYLNNNYASALVTLERALRIEPKHAEIWSRMAQAYLKLKQLPEAAQHAKRSNGFIKNNPSLKKFNNDIIVLTTKGEI